MHRCVSASNASVPSKSGCYCLQGGSDTLSARIHRNCRRAGLIWKRLILCANFSSIILQTTCYFEQKSEQYLTIHMTGWLDCNCPSGCGNFLKGHQFTVLDACIPEVRQRNLLYLTDDTGIHRSMSHDQYILLLL